MWELRETVSAVTDSQLACSLEKRHIMSLTGKRQFPFRHYQEVKKPLTLSD
jgi:hypothetical protein